MLLHKPMNHSRRYAENAICTKCGMEFGDHRAKKPHILRMVVKKKTIECSGFAPKKFFAPVDYTTPPVAGCKNTCGHIYCNLLKQAKGTSRPSNAS